MLRLAKLLKLLRIVRALRIVKRHEDTLKPLMITMGLVLLMAWVMHSLGCFWFLVGLTDNGDNCVQPLAGAGFELAGTGAVACGRGWVIRRGWTVCDMEQEANCSPGSVTLFEAYCTSFSDIFLRTTIQVETAPEKLYLVMAELLISLLFGAIAGVIFSQISSMRTTQENYNARLEEMKEFCVASRLSKPLSRRLISFHKFLYEGGTVFDEKLILSNLPLHIQRDAVYEKYGQLIKESYFFLGIQHNDSAVMRICMELQATAALADDEIYREGDIGDHMYFLLEGQILHTTEALLGSEAAFESPPEKPFAQLKVKWQYNTDAVSRTAFQSWLEPNDRKTDYSEFCAAMTHVSGIFCPVDKTSAISAYAQRKSEVGAHAVGRAQRKPHVEQAGKHDVASSEWELSFKEKDGCWQLSNGVLRGSMWSDKTQAAWRAPLGSETMWKWNWVTSSQNETPVPPIPPVLVPLSIVVFVELISPPLCFGELEMMRIGGGACGCGGGENWCGECGRTREKTARAMTDSRMCRLSADSFARLRQMYPREMGHNTSFALKMAHKKDPGVLQTNRRASKSRNDTMRHKQQQERSMLASVDSLDSWSTLQTDEQSTCALLVHDCEVLRDVVVGLIEVARQDVSETTRHIIDQALQSLQKAQIKGNNTREASIVQTRWVLEALTVCAKELRRRMNE